MITQLLESLNGAIEDSPGIAVFVAFVWGVLSVLLSPCHLASIPLIVGFIGRRGATTTTRAFLISIVFSSGIMASIGAVGAITAVAGRVVGDLGPVTNWFVAALFLFIGLVLLDLIKLPWSAPGQVDVKTTGLPAALLLGLVFGVATGPCTFAYMAPMLGVTFGVASSNLAYAILLLAIYGLGHCLVIVVAGTSTELVQKYMNWNAESKATVILRRICGLLVIAGAAYLIYTS